ncbi:Hypothetical predicted protein [Paramuricea clavata]|uniref:Uncharacterized protein n=1 Tax=Paramuricea clavata TaxID=317549 RepID=A0A7D9H9C0_PARCT|nr:Hypothetical predicted protein [Paramuricea clavata]
MDIDEVFAAAAKEIENSVLYPGLSNTEELKACVLDLLPLQQRDIKSLAVQGTLRAAMSVLQLEENKKSPKKSMVWSKAKDLILLKEIAAEGVMSNKPRSRERGMQWQRIADNITALGQGVTSRAVRDHYNVMAKKYRARMAQEERSTGEGGAELTEAESLLEELIHIEREMERQVENENEENQQRIEQERGQALEMRERAMETLGQTRKRTRQNGEGSGKEQKRRRSGDMMKWLQERVELEKEEKKAKREEEREYHEVQRVQQEEMTQAMHQTQQQFAMQMKLSDQFVQQQLQQQQQQHQQHQQEFNFLQQQMIAIMQQQHSKQMCW